MIYGPAKCPTTLIYVAAQRAAHSTGFWPFIVTQGWSSSRLEGLGWQSHLVRQALLQRFTFSIINATWIAQLEAFILRIRALTHDRSLTEDLWNYSITESIVCSLLLLMELYLGEKKIQLMAFLAIQCNCNETNDSSRCQGERTAMTEAQEV